MMVVAPCLASSTAVSNPTPLLPPVTTAVLPVKSGMSAAAHLSEFCNDFLSVSKSECFHSAIPKRC